MKKRYTKLIETSKNSSIGTLLFLSVFESLREQKKGKEILLIKILAPKSCQNICSFEYKDIEY